MDIINEKQSKVLKLSFKSVSGIDVIPSSGTYRIDDVGSSTQIRGNTSFYPSSAYHNILLDIVDNTLVSANNPYEMRILTVTIVASGITTTAEFKYLIKNMMFIT